MVLRPVVLVLLFTVVPAAAGDPGPLVLYPRPTDGPLWILEPVAAPPGPTTPSSGDTVVFFGGPGTTQGKFEDATGAPTFGDWIPVDRTERPGGWQTSPFMAENLGGHGPGNRAMWAGVDGVDAGFVAGAGYGNLWDAILLYESPPVDDPSIGQTVDLEFFFNLDAADPDDRLRVEYETSTGWRTVLDVDALDDPSFASYAVPGVRFTDWQRAPIRYDGDDYADGDRIRIRIRFRADARGSDQDGLVDGDGPVQIDDVVLTTRDGTLTEDFEGPGPYLFCTHRQWFGDFAGLYVGPEDLDAVRGNPSAVVAFVDRGQDAWNPMPDGTASTGGVAGTAFAYGPDGAVVHSAGGLSGEDALWTEVWSPEIDLTLTAGLVDDATWTGFWFEADVYTHVATVPPPVRFTIGVRARNEDGAWTPWVTAAGAVDGPVWFRARTPFDLFVPGFHTKDYRIVQFALGAIGLALPSSPDVLTPAPYFDNVRVLRSRDVTATAAPGVRRRPSLEVTPNPFNPRTTVRVRLSAPVDLELAVHDLRGHHVRTLHVGRLPTGDHVFVWNGTDDREQSVASGVYLVRAIGAGTMTTKKIALVR